MPAHKSELTHEQEGRCLICQKYWGDDDLAYNCCKEEWICNNCNKGHMTEEKAEKCCEGE